MIESGSWREMNRTYLKDVVPLDTPYLVAIETSASCNAKCVYCLHSKRNFGGNMSMDVYKKLIDDLKKFPHKIKKIDMFCFGEPLCNPNLAKMIGYAKSQSVAGKIDIISNGILFDKNKVDEIIGSGVDTIRISLQGLDSESYKKVCGVDLDFDRFVKKLEYLYRNKNQAKVYMKIADIAINGVENGREKLEEIFGGISDGVYVEHIIPMFADVNYEAIDENISKQQRDGTNMDNIRSVCSSQFFKIRVGYNGDITSPCCDPDRCLYLGNVKSHNIADLWNGSKYKSFLRMHLLGKRHLRMECKNCPTPNDVAGDMDVLDGYEEEILRRMDERNVWGGYDE